METMKSLVSVVNGLLYTYIEFRFLDRYKDIMYQKMSDDWYLLDDSVFAVRIYLLLTS